MLVHYDINIVMMYPHFESALPSQGGHQWVSLYFNVIRKNVKWSWTEAFVILYAVSAMFCSLTVSCLELFLKLPSAHAPKITNICCSPPILTSFRPNCFFCKINYILMKAQASTHVKHSFIEKSKYFKMLNCFYLLCYILCGNMNLPVLHINVWILLLLCIIS